MNADRWRELHSRIGIEASASEYDALINAYSEPHRRYHTIAHIDDCLDQLDVVAHLIHAPHEIEMALWFHDAVYDTHSSTNEEDSAAWARRYLIGQGASVELVDNVCEHIMATAHRSVVTREDSQWMVDIDLSILGRSEDEYNEFEKNIRREYHWVDEPLFKVKRAEILESFLARASIYHTPFFRQRYEQQARMNLAQTVKQLRASMYAQRQR